MNLGEYLAKEKINSGIDDFVKHAKRALPKNLATELERIAGSACSGCEELNELYEFSAKHNLFTLLWRMNRQRIMKTTPFVLKNGVTGRRKVLDAGCSDGLKTVYYALACPETQFIGIDRCRGPIQLAKERAEKYKLKNVEFAHADLNQSCFRENSFDSIIATHVLHETFYVAYGCGHSDGIQAFYEFNKQLRELARILAPEGRLVISLGVLEDARVFIANQIRHAADHACLKEEKFSDMFRNNGSPLINFIYLK